MKRVKANGVVKTLTNDAAVVTTATQTRTLEGGPSVSTSTVLAETTSHDDVAAGSHGGNNAATTSTTSTSGTVGGDEIGVPAPTTERPKESWETLISKRRLKKLANAEFAEDLVASVLGAYVRDWNALLLLEEHAAKKASENAQIVYGKRKRQDILSGQDSDTVAAIARAKASVLPAIPPTCVNLDHGGFVETYMSLANRTGLSLVQRRRVYELCVQELVPLFKKLKKRRIVREELQIMLDLARSIKRGELRKANELYLKLAMGNVDWLMGLESVGIHNRRDTVNRNREGTVQANVFDNNKRRYVQSIKRVLSFASRCREALRMQEQ